MTRRLTTTILATVGAVAVLAGGASVAAASSGSAKAAVPIVMHDPGCHWFSVGGKYKSSLTVSGATTFQNIDEAALVFKGKGFLHKVAVGKSITVSAPGTYHITMVGQKPDDNHLLLVVK